MPINLIAVLACAVLAMIVGAIWYGPIFGKTWMRLMGTDTMSEEECNQQKKRAMPLYVVQFVLSLVQVFILSHLTGGTAMSGIVSAALVWAGFVLPTVAASCMWTSEPRRSAWTRFLIQAGYQLVMFVIYGAVLGVWH